MAIHYPKIAFCVVLVILLIRPAWVNAGYQGPELLVDIPMVPQSEWDTFDPHSFPPPCDNSSNICYRWDEKNFTFGDQFFVWKNTVYYQDAVTERILMLKGREIRYAEGASDLHSMRCFYFSFLGASIYTNELFVKRDYGACCGGINLEDYAFLTPDLHLVRILDYIPKNICNKGDVRFYQDHFECGMQAYSYEGADLGMASQINMQPALFPTTNGPAASSLRRWTKQKIEHNGQESYIWSGYSNISLDDATLGIRSPFRLVAFDTEGTFLEDTIIQVDPKKIGHVHAISVSPGMDFSVLSTVDGTCPPYVLGYIKGSSKRCTKENCCGGKFEPRRLRVWHWRWEPPKGMPLKKIQPRKMPVQKDVHWTTTEEYTNEVDEISRIAEHGGKPSSLKIAKSALEYADKMEKHVPTLAHLESLQMVADKETNPVKKQELLKRIEEVKEKRAAAKGIKKEVVPKEVQPEVSTTEEGNPYLPWLYLAGILALLSALIVTVIVIRRRN